MPPCEKYQPSPCFSIVKPDGEGPDADRRDHLLHRAATALRRLARAAAAPRWRTSRDRSAWSTVRPRPARDRRATDRPSAAPVRSCARAACASRCAGSGCSIGAVGHAERVEHRLVRELRERPAGRVGQRELLDRDAAARVLEAGQRRPLQADLAAVRRRLAVENLHHGRPRRRLVARESRSRRRCLTCGSSATAASPAAPREFAARAASTISGSC